MASDSQRHTKNFLCRLIRNRFASALSTRVSRNSFNGLMSKAHLRLQTTEQFFATFITFAVQTPSKPSPLCRLNWMTMRYAFRTCKHHFPACFYGYGMESLRYHFSSSFRTFSITRPVRRLICLMSCLHFVKAMKLKGS